MSGTGNLGSSPGSLILEERLLPHLTSQASFLANCILKLILMPTDKCISHPTSKNLSKKQTSFIEKCIWS